MAHSSGFIFYSISITTIFQLVVNLRYIFFQLYAESWHTCCFIAVQLLNQLTPELHMQIKRKLRFKGSLDPFSLLKFSQAYREIQPGDQLEILYEGAGLPQELFKLMPTGGFEVVSEQALENEALFRLVLEKRQPPETELTGGSCQCT